MDDKDVILLCLFFWKMKTTNKERPRSGQASRLYIISSLFRPTSLSFLWAHSRHRQQIFNLLARASSSFQPITPLYVIQEWCCFPPQPLLQRFRIVFYIFFQGFSIKICLLKCHRLIHIMGGFVFFTCSSLFLSFSLFNQMFERVVSELKRIQNAKKWVKFCAVLIMKNVED